MTKPYDGAEFRARVAAQLRRSRISRQTEKRIDFGLLRLDPALQRASFADRELMLKPKEYLILSELVRRHGEVVSEETLYQKVWGQAAKGDSRTLYVNISTLRTKLRDAGADALCVSREEGVGYRLLVEENM
jgi:DNA-binding response OmpR family regulator